MAHFARIEEGIVRDVVTVNNDALDGGEFPASEALGQDLLAEAGIEGEFVQCSYSGSFRSAYPGQGWLWDGENFTPPPAPPISEAL